MIFVIEIEIQFVSRRQQICRSADARLLRYYAKGPPSLSLSHLSIAQGATRPACGAHHSSS
jgi:hypothetical protein